MSLRAGIAITFLALWHASDALAQNAQLIARAQRVPVATLDSGLQAIPFAQWLATLRRLPASGLHWEVNDCGEGGDGRAAPTCVEAILNLGPDTTAHASLIMAGLDGRPGKPAIWMLYVQVRDSITTVKRLGDWAAYVRPRADAEAAAHQLLEVELPARFGGTDSASGRAMAALWTTDGTHGGLVPGRLPRVGAAAVEALWVGGMAQRSRDYARRLAVKVSMVQVLSADLAAVDAVMTYSGGVRPDGTPQPETRELLYAVLRLTSAGWRIAASRVVPVAVEVPK